MNFPRSEFEQRNARLQAALDRAGLDALLVTNEANFNYFTGFIVQQPWVSLSRNLVAVLPREGEPVVVVPTSLRREAPRETWVDRIESHEVVGAAPVEAIARLCRELGLEQGRIGAELGYEQRLNLSYLDVERLRAALPEAQLVDGSDALWEVRVRKSPAEIACLRQACAATDRAFAEIFAEARPGMTERDIARRAAELMLAAGADRPGWVMLTSGRGEYHRTLGTPRDRAVQPGEMLWLDLAAIVNGYWSDFCRSGVFGGPTDEQRELQAKVWRATLAGVAAIGPGVPVAEVAAACNRELEQGGLAPLRVGRVGHGLGLLSTEPPNVALDDPTVLAPGMVVTVEPTVIRDEGIYEAELDVVVTDAGHEVLSTSPPEIWTLSSSSTT